MSKLICVYDFNDNIIDVNSLMDKLPSNSIYRASQIYTVTDHQLYVIKDRFNQSNINLGDIKSKLRLLDLLK